MKSSNIITSSKEGKLITDFFTEIFVVQVVWRAMQEEFIRQYKYIEDLLQRCYPGAQISLDFAMTDILEYFSDIAMNH